MNRKDVLTALDEISNARIEKAANPPQKKTKRVYWYSSIAAVLAIAILLGVFLTPGSTLPGQIGSPTAPTDPLVPTYPQVPTFTPQGPKLVSLSGQTIAGAVYPAGYVDEDISQHFVGFDAYLTRTMEQFLQGDENAVFSPMNLYMALAMLAESTGGDTRAEILSLLGAPNTDILRWHANAMWKNAFRTGKYPCTLANSVWLQEGTTYNEDTMNLLAKEYFASVFGHDFAAPDAAEPIAKWINKETGDLLKEQTADLSFDPNTVMSLLSTVYMHSEWVEPFEEKNNTQGVFHSSQGDITCTYMNGSTHLSGGGLASYYEGADYEAVPNSVVGGYTMWLILPKTGKTTDDLLKSGEYTELLRADRPNGSHATVNLTMPKFDISSKQDMIGGLKELGIKNVFDRSAADFTPAFPDNVGIRVYQAQQATRVSVDEKGITAASFVEISSDWQFVAGEVINFVLDRPFLFVLTTTDNVPLFAGTVNNP